MWTLDEMDALRIDRVKNGFVVTVEFVDLKRPDDQYVVEGTFDETMQFIEEMTKQ